MKRFLIGVASLAATLSFGASAFAMTVQSVTFNGDLNTSVSAGASVSMKATHQLTAGEALVAMSVEFPGYPDAPQCLPLNPHRINSGTYSETKTVKVPKYTGNYSPLIKFFQMPVPGTNDLC